MNTLMVYSVPCGNGLLRVIKKVCGKIGGTDADDIQWLFMNPSNSNWHLALCKEDAEEGLVATEQQIKIKKLLDPYDKYRLECDGFVRIASYLLDQEGIKHTIHSGFAIVPNDDFVVPHWWIEVKENGRLLTVDYRLRCWVGDTAPHGVFYNNDLVTYEHVSVLNGPISKKIFDLLIHIGNPNQE